LNSFYTIASNVVNVSNGKENSKIFYFWQSNGDSLILYNASLSNNFENPQIKYSVKIKGNYNILSLAGDFVTGSQGACFTIIHSPELNQAITLSGNNLTTINKTDISEELNLSSLKNYYVAPSNFKGPDKIFFYSFNNDKLKRIDLQNKGKNIVISSVADVNNVGDYLIKNMDMRSFHFVYINKKENCLTFHQL
jgi:hypothetical protein